MGAPVYLSAAGRLPDLPAGWAWVDRYHARGPGGDRISRSVIVERGRYRHVYTAWRRTASAEQRSATTPSHHMPRDAFASLGTADEVDSALALLEAPAGGAR